MPKRIENQRVYRRYRNGGCVIDRICRGCGDAFIGERNICPACRNLKRRISGKFGADYHRGYYQKRLSRSAMLHSKGELTRQGQMAELRKAAWEKQRDRIWAELAAGVE